MPLHPDLEAFLELANAQPQPMRAMSPQQARAAYDRSTLALDPPGPEVAVEALQFDGRDGLRIPAQLYRGKATGAREPTLLFFHGGGYVLGGLASHDGLCRTLAHEAPCAVLAVDYRLAPEYRFPAAFDDAQDALHWLLRNGPAHGLDSRRIAIGGDSVGGTLAAALCIAERDAGRPQPLLQLLLYPCTAAWQDSDSHRRLASGYLLEHDNLQWMFRQYLRSDVDRLDWRFAPLAAANLSGLAPAHVALAEYDPLLDEGRRYGERLAAAGVPVEVQVYAGMVHDFARLSNVVDEAGALRRRLAQVLAKAFAPARPAEHPSVPPVLSK
ncbi:alpha/beta hydrolase [Variovorax sp. WS11]|uniref:alpha/beta hydrolase n=1 Tax=Variovorax sp. WS11 TaxID=1105204 RepID=UPI000D0E202F|nr:alpha/beta hydrolase [Variovorax sp. WS11]NDZ18051.1 alpha/beta hydrolase [Variovorax sp. WS11]PSL80023.1 alpha/beta hydrolase [Variovorax sp. WS11]